MSFFTSAGAPSFPTASLSQMSATLFLFGPLTWRSRASWERLRAPPSNHFETCGCSPAPRTVLHGLCHSSSFASRSHWTSTSLTEDAWAARYPFRSGPAIRPAGELDPLVERQGLAEDLCLSGHRMSGLLEPASGY